MDHKHLMSDPKQFMTSKEFEAELFRRNPALEKLVEEKFNRLQLAKKLKALREGAKLTQVQAAKASGIKQPNIARLEAGSALPDLDTIKRLVAAYGRGLELEFPKLRPAAR